MDTVNGKPLAYFITFTTFGTWLHGHERTSVERQDNQFGTPRLPPSEWYWRERHALLKGATVVLTDDQRNVCTATMKEVCRHRGWTLHALNVRTNHVHAVVSAEAKAERVMGDLKAYGTRRMRERGLIQPGDPVWTSHGSTRYLWTLAAVAAARTYVIERQGRQQGIGAALVDCQ